MRQLTAGGLLIEGDGDLPGLTFEAGVPHWSREQAFLLSPAGQGASPGRAFRLEGTSCAKSRGGEAFSHSSPVLHTHSCINISLVCPREFAANPDTKVLGSQTD